jgi:prepilin-type N-terminal cleavage/methylation domain-containing protein
MRQRAAGFTLIELMIALAVVSVGMLGLLGLHINGMNSNQGARLQMRANQLARELATGLQQIPASDGLLAPTGGATTAASPTPFGSLLSDTSGLAQTWADSYATRTTNPVKGVTLDADLEHDGDGTPLFKRRWTVWGYASSNGAPSAPIIAVSVIYHERAFTSSREVVYWAHKFDPSAVMSNLAAYR